MKMSTFAAQGLSQKYHVRSSTQRGKEPRHSRQGASGWVLPSSESAVKQNLWYTHAQTWNIVQTPTNFSQTISSILSSEQRNQMG